ncbi:hypothetical protein [Buttiauxella sp. A111]|uniref:hypothetical protein n=1 Tax=Buttiauxella sp. A111 TaxID=2563088 RepID=UPI0010ED5CD2|nr:hypothetical protein [Buttiauxella sp. A111]GDX04394.1 hypothetical protein BSPA111_05590 [Buttiauxella sp. A111]
MELLNAQCGEVVQLCGRDNDAMVVLAMAEGHDHSTIIGAGWRVRLFCSLHCRNGM